MKIVITGITSFRNHGVEALVTTTIDQLRQRLAPSSFLVLDRVPEYDSTRIKSSDVTFAYDNSIRPLTAGTLRKGLLRLSHVASGFAGEYQNTLRSLRTANAVVASGGDVFCSEYGHRSLLSHLEPLRIARQAGAPFFIHAQSIGPFKNEADTRVFRETAKDAAHVTVRERMSHAYAIETLALSPDRVTLTGDPAFLLKRTEAAWKEHFGCANKSPVIALSTSQAICNWMGSDYETHFKTWCTVIQWLRRELDAHLILIPHVQELSSRNDDRILATDLARHFGFDPHLQIAGGDFSASDFKGIISQCDLVIAERMHAAIAGLSNGVPTVVIGYSVKAEGILSDLLDPALVKESTLIPLQDFLKESIAIQRIQNAWTRRDEIAKGLGQNLPAMKQRAALSFDVIARALK